MPGLHERDIMRVALDHLHRDPILFLHPADAGCAECDKARTSTLQQPLTEPSL